MRPMMPAVPAGFVDGNRVRATPFHAGVYMHTPSSLLSCLMCLSLFNILFFLPLFLSLNIQPFYMPLTWPIGHVSSGIMRDPNEKVSSPTAAPDLDIVGKRENEENEN